MEALRAKYGLPAVPPPPGELMEEEVVWRDRQEWLEGLGYRLRPRYRKDWVPSWGDNFDGGAEDSVSVMVSPSNVPTLVNPDLRICIAASPPGRNRHLDRTRGDAQVHQKVNPPLRSGNCTFLFSRATDITSPQSLLSLVRCFGASRRTGCGNPRYSVASTILRSSYGDYWRGGGLLSTSNRGNWLTLRFCHLMLMSPRDCTSCINAM